MIFVLVLFAAIAIASDKKESDDINPYEQYDEKTATMYLEALRQSNKAKNSGVNGQNPRRLVSFLKIAFGGLIAFVAFAIFALLAILFVPAVQRGLIFLNLDSRPFINWSNPEIPVQGDSRIGNHQGIQNVEAVRTTARKLFGWSMMGTAVAKNMSKYTVLYYHGNSGHIGRFYRVNLYKLLNKLGMNVLSFDYTGFGVNKGWPSEETLGLDAHDMIQTAFLKLNRDEKLIVWGHSLGTGATFQMLRRLDPKHLSRIHAVILEAPFRSILDVVHDTYLPKLLRGPTAKNVLSHCLYDHINSHEVVQALKKLPFKVYILHSTRDGEIPIKHGRAMQAALAKITTVVFEEIDSGTHNEITARPDFQGILQKFIKHSEE